MSPIKLYGESSFNDKVVVQLNNICPGVTKTGCTTDSYGMETCTVDTSGIACPEYCGRRSACNLLLALSNDVDTVWIEDGEGDFLYLQGSNTVWWSNQKGPVDECTNCGGAIDFQMNKTAVLVHELIHAYHDVVTGTYRDSSTHLTEEGCTVCGENQIRKQLGRKRRCTYGGVCIKCGPSVYAGMSSNYGYDCRLVPKSVWLNDCSCPSSVTEIWSDTVAFLFVVVEPLVAGIRAFLAFLIGALGGRPRRGRGPEPAAETDAFEARQIRDSGFGDLTPDDPLKRDEFERALRALVRGRESWSHHDVIEDAYQAADHALLLEIVSLQGGYRVMLMEATGDSGSLVTNIGRAETEDDLPLPPQSDLVRHTIMPAVARSLADELQDPVFWNADGSEASVQLGVSDGSAHFLTVKSPGRERRIAVRGFDFRAGPRASAAPLGDADDASRWSAVRRAREMVAARHATLVRPGSVVRESGLVEEDEWD